MKIKIKMRRAAAAAVSGSKKTGSGHSPADVLLPD